MEPITDKRWNEAQEAERKFHDGKSLEEKRQMYLQSYRQYFDWCNIDPDLVDKTILEIGCADVPALLFTLNSNSVIIEPMPSSQLIEVMKGEGVDICTRKLEEVKTFKKDECWLFNVMQHVQDPEKCIENIKAMCKTIRFFEPIDTEISDCHPHAYTQEDYERWFPGSVKIYDYNPNAVNFHTHKCAYGVYDNV